MFTGIEHNMYTELFKCWQC